MRGARGTAIVAALGLALAAGACGSSSSTSEPTASEPATGATVPAPPLTIRLTSPAFKAGGRIPTPFTCDGIDDSPPLRWSGVPNGTAQLALFMEDPGAEGGTFTHWAVFGIPPTVTSIARGAVPAGARQASTGFSKTHYGGPCPPHGDSPHRYVFTLYALRAPITLPHGSLPADIHAAVDRATLAAGRLTATYTRA